MKKLIKISAILAIINGVIMLAGGMYGVKFTYNNIKRENIVTPADSAIPNKKVIGPTTLKAQADIIREHTLKITGGKTYAEMDREDPARSTWITATTLTTALNLAILAYVFSGLFALLGVISICTGVVYFGIIMSQVEINKV